MKITSVRMKKLNSEDSSVLATASVQFDNCLVVHNIKLVKLNNGSRVVSFPNKKIRKYEYDSEGAMTQNYEYTDIVHPSNQEFREYVQEELFKIYDNEGGTLGE